MMDLALVFLPFQQTPPDRPFVVAQLGQSLDGRIATISGESRWINGGPALDHLHQIRAHVDAVVVGAGTIVADNPSLNVRRVPGKNPARIAIDPNGRLVEGTKWLTEDGAPKHLISCQDRPLKGADLIVLPRAMDGTISPHAIVKALFELGYRRILIEGGARTISNFMDAGCVDRLHLLVAPVIIGSGKTGLDLRPEPRLDLALRPPTTVHHLGNGEVLFDCDLSQRSPS